METYVQGKGWNTFAEMQAEVLISLSCKLWSKTRTLRYKGASRDHSNKLWLQLEIFAIIFAAGAIILLMSVHILFWIDILKESLGKCRNE